jgi:4-hydroxy-2-oxoheptanedioate aldolase
MRPNRLREIWASGKQANDAWLAIQSIFSAEMMAQQGWDSLTVDMQHGQADYAALIQMLVAISTGNSTPLVRVPYNNPGDVMRALDAGVYGVICPNVDTVAQCRQFVNAMRSAPAVSGRTAPRSTAARIMSRRQTKRCSPSCRSNPNWRWRMSTRSRR